MYKNASIREILVTWANKIVASKELALYKNSSEEEALMAMLEYSDDYLEYYLKQMGLSSSTQLDTDPTDLEKMFTLKGTGAADDPYLIQANYSLYSTGGVSAYGNGLEGSGGGLIQTVYPSTALAIDNTTNVYLDTVLTDTFNARTIQYIYNNVPHLDETNQKILLKYFPDTILGQVIYGGTVDATGTCTLTDNAKTKLGIETPTFTLTDADHYEGVYFISTAVGTSGVPLTLQVNQGDWIIGNGAAGWAKVDNTDAVTSVAGRIGTIVLTPEDVFYNSVDSHYVYAAPASAAGLPSFRQLGISDILWGTISANYAFASPNNSSGSPSFRHLVYTDVTGVDTIGNVESIKSVYCSLAVITYENNTRIFSGGSSLAFDTGTNASTYFLCKQGVWKAVDMSAYLPLSGGTMTGQIAAMGIYPKTTNSYALGLADHTWSNIYSTLGTFTTRIKIGDFYLESTSTGLKLYKSSGNANLYATGGISAYGEGTSGSSGLISTVYKYNQIASSLGLSDLTTSDTFNAYTIQKLYQTLTGLTLNGLSDVVVSSPSSGQILQYNGTNWVNSSISIGAVLSVTSTAQGLTATTNSGSVVLSLTSGYSIPTTARQTAWDLVAAMFEMDGNSIKAKYSLYSVGGISAYGDGTGGTSGLISQVYKYSQLTQTTPLSLADATQTDTFNAYTIQQLYNSIVALQGGSAMSLVTTGNGNAVTDISKSGTVITVTKAQSFSLSGHTHLISEITSLETTLGTKLETIIAPPGLTATKTGTQVDITYTSGYSLPTIVNQDKWTLVASLFSKVGSGTTESPYTIQANFPLYSVGGITAYGSSAAGEYGVPDRIFILTATYTGLNSNNQKLYTMTITNLTGTCYFDNTTTVTTKTNVIGEDDNYISNLGGIYKMMVVGTSSDISHSLTVDNDGGSIWYNASGTNPEDIPVFIWLTH